jgi:hypothetical protein
VTGAEQSSLRQAIHWSGPILTAGGVALGLAILVVALRPVDERSVTPTVGALLLVAAALLLLALPAAYAVQAEETGWMGLVGHGLLATGLLLLVMVSATPVLHPNVDLPPGDNPLLFVLAVAFIAGLLLTGIATWRAGVMPRAAAILLLAGMARFAFSFFVAELVPPPLGQSVSALFAALLGLGFGWMGLTLWRGEPDNGRPTGASVS